MDNFFIKNRFKAKAKEDNKVVVSSLPTSRVSVPSIEQSFLQLSNAVDFIKPGFEYEYIPVIRKLLRVNSSVSLAATTIVELANTGIDITFGKDVPSEQQREMRSYILNNSKKWGSGVAGLHGIINKLIYQTYIGGAISGEWVLKNDLSGVKLVALVNPESIRVRYNQGTQEYEYFQVPSSLTAAMLKSPHVDPTTYIKLNTLTYKYFGLIGDEDSPVGIPPFLSALDDLYAQLKMLKNIGYVSDQLGLMGFMEVLTTKPSPNEGESTTAYQGRLTQFLDQIKQSLKGGLKDGIVAGYDGDHTFDFHSTTKDTGGVADIFDINHRMVANGLFTSPAFMSGAGGGAETMVNIVFTKMLSQLHNIQTNIAAFLETGIALDLQLGGYNFSSVKVEFKPSTITDALKQEQAKEIKVRNNRVLYADGIISQEDYAIDMGFEGPDQKEPRVEIDPAKVMQDAKDAKDREKDKDSSDRTSRDKNKSQPKRTDQDTRKR